MDEGIALTVDSFRELVVYLVQAQEWIGGAASCLRSRGL